MWWITNQILKAGVKKITVMGESAAKNWATAAENGEKFSHSVEVLNLYTKSALEIFASVFIFNYFRNYPFFHYLSLSLSLALQAWKFFT
jgi:hypothetical protein